MTVGEQEILYTVVMNGEEQYSIWPTFKDIPLGWKEVGKSGTKEVCLNYIQEVWKDMRPLTLRKKMEERQKNWEEQKRKILDSTPSKPSVSPTVLFLSNGAHPISLQSSYKDSQELRSAIQRKLVHITFVDTQGRTCISMRIENTTFTSDRVHIEGKSILDFVPIYCVADVDLASLHGEGYLKIDKTGKK